MNMKREHYFFVFREYLRIFHRGCVVVKKQQGCLGGDLYGKLQISELSVLPLHTQPAQ